MDFLGFETSLATCWEVSAASDNDLSPCSLFFGGGILCHVELLSEMVLVALGISEGHEVQRP